MLGVSITGIICCTAIFFLIPIIIIIVIAITMGCRNVRILRRVAPLRKRPATATTGRHRVHGSNAAEMAVRRVRNVTTTAGDSTGRRPCGRGGRMAVAGARRVPPAAG